MAGQTARVQLGLSNQEFINGLNEATRRAQGFESTLGGLFRRSPLARAERAFSELATNLATGNVAQGIGQFATRLTGLGGLLAGAAIGAGVAVFERLSTTIREAALATEALNLQIDKPHNIAAGLGVAGITSELQKTVQLTDQLIAKTTTFGARLSAAFRQGGILGGVSAFLTGGRFDLGTGDIGAALGAQLKTRQDLAKAETQIADIREKALIGSEKEATLDDISRRAAEQKNAILNETLEAQNKITLLLKEDAANRAIGKAGLTPSEIKRLEQTRAALGAEDPERIAAIEKIAALERVTAAQKFDVKSKELDIERAITAESLLGISVDDQKITKLQAQLALLQEQLRPTNLLTEEQRKQLQLAEVKTKAELSAAMVARGPVSRPAISVLGEQPRGIYDPGTGEFRQVLRPQEQANLRAGQAEAMSQMRADQMQYESQMRGWESRYQDYLRGAEYYAPAELKRSQPPAGYEIDLATGRAIQRPQQPKPGATKEEFQAALDAVMGKYWQ